jgi:hypothetical protein
MFLMVPLGLQVTVQQQEQEARGRTACQHVSLQLPREHLRRICLLYLLVIHPTPPKDPNDTTHSTPKNCQKHTDPRKKQTHPPLPHLLELELLHACLIRGDGGALDANIVLLRVGEAVQPAAMHGWQNACNTSNHTLVRDWLSSGTSSQLAQLLHTLCPTQARQLATQKLC